jgi:MYXO-CTERM domain-containing protein
MLRSLLLPFGVLVLFSACAQDGLPVIAARTELLDVGDWYMGGWCNSDSECEPTGGLFVSYDMAGIDAVACVDYQCRVFEYTHPTVGGVVSAGRCFVRRDPAVVGTCDVPDGLTIYDLMDPDPDQPEFRASSGLSVPSAIADLEFEMGGLGKPCEPTPDDPLGTPCDPGLTCRDGVCCRSDCNGGDVNDCFACSVDKGGARDGLCTAVVTLKDCSTGEACVENQRCLPTLFSVGGVTPNVFSGECQGESTLGLEIAGAVCCLEDRNCPDDSDGDKCTVPKCVDNQCIEKLAYEGCCVSDAQCDDGSARTCDRCVETGRIGWKVCESVEASLCGDAGVLDASVVIDASVVFPDLGEWPRDASIVGDAEVDLDGAIARDAAPRDGATGMDGEVARDGDVDDADVANDASAAKDADVVDAASVRVTPVFRGGGGIRCAVSGAPGSEPSRGELAGVFGLSMIGLILSRRRRR